MQAIAQPQVLRVAAVWGTTVVGVRMLERGQSYAFGDDVDPGASAPGALQLAPVPLRAIPGGWEANARGCLGGVLKLRGRDEDPAHLGQIGVPIPVLPGDFGLFQYGQFALFFQYTAPGTPIGARVNFELLMALAVVSSGVLHAGALGLLRATSTPPAIPKPLELTNEDELAKRFKLHRTQLEEPPPVVATTNEDKSGGGSGVKDPGARDPKKQGGGQKIAGAEGKAGLGGKENRNELPGEIRPTRTYGGLSEVLSSEQGQEIRQTLKSINTVADALGGLNSNNVVLGSGPGTGMKGSGSGGGGTGDGVMFGAGNLATGWGPGSGGGYGSGSGGPGGRGSGGPGGGGSGGGTGGGSGSGSGPGEKGVTHAPGTGPTKGGLTPEQIRRVVVAHMGALRACYEIEAQKNPSLKGGVTVAWTIDPSGGVSGASLAGSSIQNPRVEGCVVRQVRTWRFPASESSTSTTFPFSFGIGGR